MSLTAVLSLFTLLALSAGVYYAARSLKVPYTVLLVAVGIAISLILHIPGVEPVLGFIDDAELTPELLFFILLPLLIFESGFSMSIRRIIDNASVIAALAIIAMPIAAVGTAFTLTWLLELVGISVPFIVILLFGSIIAATDPVAVLALFKEVGAPKDLTVIFEGESLFNDGTAVALFLVVLGVAQSGTADSTTAIAGVITFVGMVIGGVLLGLLLGGAVASVVRATRANSFVTATLLLISAHIVFLIAELISESHLHVGPIEVKVSSIIATTVAALFLGNYGRQALTPDVSEYVDKVVSLGAFIANSLVFILAGLLFAQSLVQVRDLWLPMLLSVVVVATWRVISVYAVTGTLNLLPGGHKTPRSWQALMSWASLRGALAIIVVMLIPTDFEVAGWTLPETPRDFLVALTIACILVTLFIKAPLVSPIMRKLGLTVADPIDQATHADLAVHYLSCEISGFSKSRIRGSLNDDTYNELAGDLQTRMTAARKRRQEIVDTYGEGVFERALHRMALRIERHVLGQMYVNDEISEYGYRKLLSKLRLQEDYLEHDDEDRINPRDDRDRKDIFDALVHAFTKWRFHRNNETSKLVLFLETHRAEYVMSHRALDVLWSMQSQSEHATFLPGPFLEVIDRFEEYYRESETSIETIATEHPDQLAPEIRRLAIRTRHIYGQRALDRLHTQGALGAGDLVGADAP